MGELTDQNRGRDCPLRGAGLWFARASARRPSATRRAREEDVMSLPAEAADLAGPLRIPRNSARESRGSIHDDATASKLGFRGGTVAGSLHMDQFAPLVVQLHGEDWWKKGNMSFYFRQATVDREAVRAFGRAGDPHGRLWMPNEAGAPIGRGTDSRPGH